MSDVQPEEIHPPAEQRAEDQAWAEYDAERAGNAYTEELAGPPEVATAESVEQALSPVRHFLAAMTREAERMPHVDGFVYPRNPAMPAPIAPCGCTNVTKCRAHGYPTQLTAGVCRDCGHALSEHRGKPKPRPSSTACRNCNACDRELADVDPADAHEIMQRVTGQPLNDQGGIDALRRDKAREALVSAASPDQSTSLIDDWVAHRQMQQVAADEESLRAMGAKGDGGDVLFEIHHGVPFLDRDEHRLRVLLRVDPPVAAELRAQIDHGVSPTEVIAEVGEIMAAASRQIATAFRRHREHIEFETRKDQER